MRNISSRPPIDAKTQAQLTAKTNIILQESVGERRVTKADSVYSSSRTAKWFAPIIDNLESLCGGGKLCMYCSSNEPSQLDHYRTLTIFPELAMTYENYVWSCSICNHNKHNRFPPDTEAGEQILNPIDDNAWEYFILDEFGRLVKRLDPQTEQYFSRAISTCNVVGVDRENIQRRRQRRFKELRKNATRTLEEFKNHQMALSELQTEIAEMRDDHFQADVADYFLNGPGRTEEPFYSLLIAAGENIP
jgi:5-methylcytosine-specific restriction endonuclease McrA